MNPDKVAHDIALLYLSRQYDEIKKHNPEIFEFSTDYIGLANVLEKEYSSIYSELLSNIEMKRPL